MDKNEQLDAIRRIKKLYEVGSFREILTLAKGMDLSRIKEKKALEMIAESYRRTGLYKDARETLLVAYEKFPQSRGLAYKLTLISVKLEELDDAVDFYEDFCRLAPKDNNKYILKYTIGRAGGIDIADLIKVLEQYTARENDERWLYELARLYHEAGMENECVAACDEITLWYADGEYEKKALELKFMHRALTSAQQARYEQIMNAYNEEPKSEESEEEDENLEEEAESFVSEFFGQDSTQNSTESSVDETTAVPLDKIAAILNEEPDTGDTKVIPRARFTFNNLKSEIKKAEPKKTEPKKTEPKKTEPKKEEPKEESAAEPEEIPVMEEKRTENVSSAANVPPVKEKAAEEDRPRIAAKVWLSKADAAKLGTDCLDISSKAWMVTKPSLERRRAVEKENAFIKEPSLKSSVDVSEIPMANEEDGQVGINLTLVQVHDDTIEGQLTIDDFFAKYAGQVADNREMVAAVEAERVRQIMDSVSRMEPTPLYDMTFATPEEDEFKEEIAYDTEFIIEDTEEDNEDPGDDTKKEPVSEEESAREEEIVSGVESLSEVEPASEEEASSEDEAVGEEGSASEEPASEGESVSEETPASEGESISAETSAKDGESADGEETESEAGPESEEDSAAAEETIPEETTEEDGDTAAEDTEEASEENALSESIGEALEKRETEGEEVLDADVAAAIARFEAGSEEEIDDEEALKGFEDTLADMIVTEDLPSDEEGDGGYHLSDQAREEMAEFLLASGMEEQIEEACGNIIERKRSGDISGGNMIITGDKKSGKTYLAIAIIKAVIKETGIGSGKVVKVQAQPLNGKDLNAVFEKVEGRDLIIENVGYLEDETIQNLIDVMKNGASAQMVVLEGNMLAVENILMHFPEIGELFATRVNIEELTITQWAQIARDYAKEQGYEIDEMATLALHARIDKINLPTVRMGLGDIRDIVDSAISRASKRNNGRLFRPSRKGEEEQILTESDFLD